jgi:hypothetical protein
MKLSPVRILLVLLFVFIGCFGIAYAAAGMFTALPAPAIGGTCGPSTGSETAFEALAKPSSIGAGPEPSTSNTTAHHQWQTFVEQCQTLADRRGLASLAVLVISLAVAGIGLAWVLRRPKQDGRDGEGGSAAQDDPTGVPAYTPLGLHDPAPLVGAGAVVGAPAAPVAAWPTTQPPVYGAPPAYGGQPPVYGTPPAYGPPPAYGTPPAHGAPPPYSGPPAYPAPPPAHSPQSYPPVAPPYPAAAAPPPDYPAPAHPAQPAPTDAHPAPTGQPGTAPSAPPTSAASAYPAPPTPGYPVPPAHDLGPAEAVVALPPTSVPPTTAADHGAVGAGHGTPPSEDPPTTPPADPQPPA